MIKFFGAPGSCSLAPHILLVDAGIEFETESIDIFSGKPWPEEYAQLNPNKLVPFLVLKPDDILTENVAIQTYISQLAPNKHYLGNSNMEIVRSYEWMSYLSATLHAKAFGVFFKPGAFTDDESAKQGLQDRARKKVQECFEKIEQRINERKAIEGVLAVDAYLFVFFRWGNMVGFDMKQGFPKYHARMAQFAELESVKKTLADEGIPSTI